MSLRNIFGFYKTRHNLLSNSANCTVLRAVVLTQYRRVTDGQTDRRTDRRNCCSQYSACNASILRRAVKMNRGFQVMIFFQNIVTVQLPTLLIKSSLTIKGWNHANSSVRSGNVTTLSHDQENPAAKRLLEYLQPKTVIVAYLDHIKESLLTSICTPHVLGHPSL